MGDSKCNSQIDNSNAGFVKAFETISKTVLYRVDNRLKTMIFGKVPILNTISSFFIKELIEERKAMKVRDKYMESIIESAEERVSKGSGFDMTKVLSFSSFVIDSQLTLWLYPEFNM